MMFRVFLRLLVIALLSSTGLAHAQLVYKWYAKFSSQSFPRPLFDTAEAACIDAHTSMGYSYNHVSLDGSGASGTCYSNSGTGASVTRLSVCSAATTTAASECSSSSSSSAVSSSSSSASCTTGRTKTVYLATTCSATSISTMTGQPCTNVSNNSCEGGCAYNVTSVGSDAGAYVMSSGSYPKPVFFAYNLTSTGSTCSGASSGYPDASSFSAASSVASSSVSSGAASSGAASSSASSAASSSGSASSSGASSSDAGGSGGTGGTGGSGSSAASSGGAASSAGTSSAGSASSSGSSDGPMPGTDGALNGAGSALDSASSQRVTGLDTVTSTSGKDTSWGWMPALPSGGCSPFVIVGHTIDVCAITERIRVFMAWIWAFSTAYACLGMVKNTIQGS